MQPKGRILAVLIITWSIFFQAAAAWGAVDEMLFRKIEANLMCTDGCGMYLPSCDNKTAEKMRSEIKSQLSAGATEQEIYAFMIGIYGSEVMASPPKDNFLNYSAWLLPFILIIGGGLTIYLVLDRWVFNNRREQAFQGEEQLEVDPQYEEALQKELKNYY